MAVSVELVNLYLEFLEDVSRGNQAGINALLADDPGVILLGTAPDEFVEGRDAVISLVARMIEAGVQLVLGSPLGYENGDTGWVVDRSHFSFNGLEVADRITAVFTRSESGWHLVHLHHSVGIPDDRLGILSNS